MGRRMLEIPPVTATGDFPHQYSTIVVRPTARPHDADAQEDDNDVFLGYFDTEFAVHEALRHITSTPAASLEPAAADGPSFPLSPLPSLSTLSIARSGTIRCSAGRTFRQLKSRLIAKHMARESGVAVADKFCWFILDAGWYRTWSR